MTTRPTLDALMKDLERQVPTPQAAIPEEWQLEAWAKHADEILGQATEEDYSYVFECLEAMALRHGLTIGTFGTS